VDGGRGTDKVRERSRELYDSCSDHTANDGVHARAVTTRGEHGDLHLRAILWWRRISERMIVDRDQVVFGISAAIFPSRRRELGKFAGLVSSHLYLFLSGSRPSLREK